MKKQTLKKSRFVLLILSSEWLLTKLDIPNGGVVIILRALISSLIIFIIVLALKNLIDPTKSWVFSATDLRLQILNLIPLYGILFGAIYTALYARFASQWSYLANLYNSIKEIEATNGDPQILSEWKAGFIEDAENLHLAYKSSFVTIIKVWGENNLVKESYLKHAPGGTKRYKKLMANIEFSEKLVASRYKDT